MKKTSENLEERIEENQNEIKLLKEDVEQRPIYIYPLGLGLDDTDNVNTTIEKGGTYILVGEFNINLYGVRPNNNTVLDLTYATLKQIVNNEKLYYVINIKDKINVHIKKWSVNR